MYLPNRKCFHQFPGGHKIFGLCDNSEISVWLGLEDKDGKPLPFGFDFGSSVILLPGKSVLFAVPADVMEDGRAIRFGVTFQKPIEQVSQSGQRRALLRHALPEAGYEIRTVQECWDKHEKTLIYTHGCIVAGRLSVVKRMRF